MKTSVKLIEQEGTVVEIKEDGTAMVKILSMSACAECHAKGVCGTSDSKEKIINVDPEGKEISIGDNVTVVLSRILGFKALFLGYIFPFLLVITTLVIGMTITDNEAISGLASLAVLAPYYLCLYLLRKRISKAFSFKLK